MSSERMLYPWNENKTDLKQQQAENKKEFLRHKNGMLILENLKAKLRGKSKSSVL